jgi:hypothetical protein
MLQGALRAYKQEFSEENELVTLVEAGLERVQELIIEGENEGDNLHFAQAV